MRARASGPQHPGRVSGVQQRIPTLNLILNLNPKLDLIPKLITDDDVFYLFLQKQNFVTPPDTHPRYRDPPSVESTDPKQVYSES